jgi:hypothetical protein
MKEEIGCPYIEDWPSEFFLGGSRRMHQLYPRDIQPPDTSDWDVYCADTEPNRNWLAEKGFKSVGAKNKTYWDDLLIDIFKHPEFPIEVLLRYDVRLYKFSFDSINPVFFKKHLWKSSPDKTFLKERNEICYFFNDLFKEMRKESF